MDLTFTPEEEAFRKEALAAAVLQTYMDGCDDGRFGQGQLDGPGLAENPDLGEDHRSPAPLTARALDVSVLQNFRLGPDSELPIALNRVNPEPHEELVVLSELLHLGNVE